MKKKSFAIWIALSVPFAGCGVKGPPLPPVADTPQASDRTDVDGPAPSPTPIPKAKSQ